MTKQSSHTAKAPQSIVVQLKIDSHMGDFFEHLLAIPPRRRAREVTHYMRMGFSQNLGSVVNAQTVLATRAAPSADDPKVGDTVSQPVNLGLTQREIDLLPLSMFEPLPDTRMS